jgi:uridine kinase
MQRPSLLEMLADRIAAEARPHPIRVGIDGADGVGKTTLANELVEPLRRRGLPVIRASIDGFHQPRHVRYRLGRGSPEGYFRDSFDYDALTSGLLRPLGPGGSLRYRRVEGQRLYVRECDPRRAATIVVDNADLTSPAATSGSD